MIRVIEITTPDCSKCKMLKPMLEHVMKSYDSNKVILEVKNGLEDQEAVDLLQSYGIRSVPFFVFQKDDMIAETHAGVIDPNTFKNKINALL